MNDNFEAASTEFTNGRQSVHERGETITSDTPPGPLEAVTAVRGSVPNNPPSSTRRTDPASVISRGSAVSASDLQRALGVSARAIRYGVARKGWQRIGNGAYLYHSLDAKTRRKLEAWQEAQTAKAAADLLTDLPMQRVPWSLLDLTAEERELAEERRDFLMAVRQMQKERPDWSIEDCVERLRARAVTGLGVQFRRLMQKGKRGECALTVRNFKSWSGRIKPFQRHKTDYDQFWALADRYSRKLDARQGDERIWVQIKLLYETERCIPLNICFEAAMEKAKREGWSAEPNFTPPTLKQVRYWYGQKLRVADPDEFVQVRMRREGKAYRYNVIRAPIHRDWTEVAVNEIWGMDHHLFNVFVRVPNPFGAGWVAIRPWITQVLDLSSFYEVYRLIQADPNRDTIEAALRGATTAVGYIAAHMLFDNGKDYAATASLKATLGIDEARFAGICAGLGTQWHFALPKNPGAKPNEVDFAIVEKQFERTWPTYCGHNKARFDELYPMLRRTFLKTIGGEGPGRHVLAEPDNVPTLEEFTAEYDRYRREKRHTSKSDGVILDGFSPSEKWNAGASLACRPRLSREQILLAFLRPLGWQTVKPGGEVYYQPPGGTKNDRIWYSDRDLQVFLDRKEKVFIKIDIHDLSRVFVFERDGGTEENPTLRLFRCGGADGGAASVLRIPAIGAYGNGLANQEVREKLKYSLDRRRTFKKADRAQKVQAALNSFRAEKGATEMEAALIQGTRVIAERVEQQDARRTEADAYLAAHTDEQMLETWRYGNKQTKPSGGQNGNDNNGCDSDESGHGVENGGGGGV